MSSRVTRLLMKMFLRKEETENSAPNEADGCVQDLQY